MGRLRPGELIAGAAGALLIGSLFLRWYALNLAIPGTAARLRVAFSGWESMSAIDVVLALLGLVAIALPFAQILREAPAIPTGLSVLTVVAGVVAVLLVLFRLVDQPGPNRFVDVQGGAWIGFAAAAAMLAGGWLSMTRETVPGVAPPLVPRRPAPPPNA